MGRSKVVRKFLYRNFLPPEVQKGRYPCAASRPRCADTCSPFLSICRANAISCALLREMRKNADYTTFSTDRNRPALRDGFLCPRNGTTYIYLIYIHLRYAARRGEHCSPAQGKWTRINNICRLRGTARRGRTPGHLLLRRCRNSPCRALRRCLLFHSARLRGIINIDWKGGAAGARGHGRIAA